MKKKQKKTQIYKKIIYEKMLRDTNPNRNTPYSEPHLGYRNVN